MTKKQLSDYTWKMIQYKMEDVSKKKSFKLDLVAKTYKKEIKSSRRDRLAAHRGHLHLHLDLARIAELEAANTPEQPPVPSPVPARPAP